jgi:hypothetical protein
MPRITKVEQPFRHPFDMSREEVALARYNALVMQRNQALDAARALGLVRLPPNWTRHETLLPQTGAFIPTEWIGLARVRMSNTPLADALAARRPLDVRPASGELDLEARRNAHERAMLLQRPGTRQLHEASAIGAVGVDTPVAVVTATTGSSRATVASTHVVRVAELHAGLHPSIDSARAWASRRLASGEATAPLAIIRTGEGVQVASLASSSLGLGLDGEPLVGSLAASGTSLAWRRTTDNVVAIVGLDAVHWM